MLDAGDVEEVILVVVGEEPLHLRRVHAAVGLRDVDGRNAQRRKHILGHVAQPEDRAQGQPQDHNQDRIGTP